MLTISSLQRATLSGRQIAEWVMKNRSTLRLKYVIWGQRIWDVRTDKNKEKAWTSWRTMEDRGDLTANHWYVQLISISAKLMLTFTRDHVHVSFK